MRICVISIIHDSWGGSEELWAAMAEEAMENGHSVVHSRLNTGDDALKEQELQKLGLVTRRRRGYTGGTRSKWVRIVKKIVNIGFDHLIPDYRYISKSKFDAILYVGTGFSPVSDRRLLSMIQSSGLPIFVNLQLCQENGRFSTANDLHFLQKFYSSAIHLFFVSRRNHKALQNMLAQPLPHATVVRNPVNMPSTDYLPFPAYEGTARLAMVGNLLCMHKGQDVMLQVLGSEAWRTENWTLDIYGDGMDRAYLEQLVQMYGLDQKVRFCGRVSDIRGIWASHHLLLMPSVMEGMPLAVVEAMLCGRPVLATDVGGHVEWIEDGVQGYIAAAPTAAALHTALQAAWSDLPNWEQRGKAAHEKAKTLYDPAPGATLLKMIGQLLQAGQ